MIDGTNTNYIERMIFCTSFNTINKMVVRVEDLIESVLKQREEFLSIENTDPDVISVKSIGIYDDLVYILEKVPSMLMHRIAVEGEYIHITVSDIQRDTLNIDVVYDPASGEFNANISLPDLDDNCNKTESIDDFVNSLIGEESGNTLRLHPYGILFHRDSLSRSGLFLSYLYPTPIDFEDDLGEQYLYMFRDREKFYELFGFNTECFRNHMMPQWQIPARRPQPVRDIGETRCSARMKKTDAPCKNKAKNIINGKHLCGLHSKCTAVQEADIRKKPTGSSTGMSSLNNRDMEDLSLILSDEE